MSGTNVNPLDTQVGGDHYKGMRIQPLQFAMLNQWDPCAMNILKYVTRHRSKNGLQDLQKAQHYIALRAELLVRGSGFMVAVIPVQDYITQNQLPPAEAAVITALATWVYLNGTRDQMEVQVALSHLISTYAKEVE